MMISQFKKMCYAKEMMFCFIIQKVEMRERQQRQEDKLHYLLKGAQKGEAASMM